MYKITSAISNFVLPISVGKLLFSLMTVSVYFRENLCHVCCLYYDKWLTGITSNFLIDSRRGMSWKWVLFISSGFVLLSLWIFSGAFHFPNLFMIFPFHRRPLICISEAQYGANEMCFFISDDLLSSICSLRAGRYLQICSAIFFMYYGRCGSWK